MGFWNIGTLMSILGMQAALLPDHEDQVLWKWTKFGQFSPKTTYNDLFEGLIKSILWCKTWDCWAHLQCKIFNWLAVANRCCIACPCVTEVLTGFSFSYVSYKVLEEFSLQVIIRFIPVAGEDFTSWLLTATECIGNKVKGVIPLIILTL
ncbi:hypothetical protein BRADI_1g26744v3 [Brachypodium distachyon]|uniref:Reverse transcriptase zinc-binding domain-containing protein n=1 Tax=Brachypodium distachyon TaxID=15368 RepID=A0A2K2DL80_BRADI|nr:hypothetical protein BRADI_1g26744v3 [Brachypodium distachyon]